MDASEMMWSTAATDVAAEQNQRVYAMAKVAAQQVAWAFLAAAGSPGEYDARYMLVADRVTEAVAQVSAEDTALLDQVRTSLKEDHGLLLQATVDARIKTLAADWADEDGPLHQLATRGELAEALGEEIEALALASTDPTDLADLTELYSLALGREPNFTVEADGEIDPSDVQHPFDQARYDSGYEDGLYDDNAGLAEHGGHPDYQSGVEKGQEAAQDQKMNPGWYDDHSEPADPDPYVQGSLQTTSNHAPYYVREDAGTFKVVNAIGDIKGTHPTKAQALAQQAALYANVPDAAEKAERHHGEPAPAAVQEQGRQATKTARAENWMTWNGDALYDVHGNKLGRAPRVAEAKPGDGWHSAIINEHGIPQVMGTHPTKEEARARVEELVGRNLVSALLKSANQYIEKRDGSWVILQKGTGKVLSHHDSQEKAEAAFRAMEWSKHSGMNWGYLDKEGAFHPVALNEDAFGADRYQHVDPPPTPGWIHDEYTDANRVPLGDTEVKNTADGNELKPSAPWLVAEESLKVSQPSVVGTIMTGSATNISNTNLTWQVPTTLTITADNPFTVDGPGNPASMGTMPSPDDDPSQLGLTPDASSEFGNGTSGGQLGDALPNPALSNGAAADGTSMAPMPSPSDDLSQANTPATTGAKYQSPMEKIDQIASDVLASNPSLTLRQCVAVATQTIRAHPELVRA